MSRRLALTITVLVALLVAAPAAWRIKRNADARRIEASAAAATSFADKDDNITALARLDEIERVAPEDPRLPPLLRRVAIQPRVTTNPEGAQVFVKGYADDKGGWRSLGSTPIENARLPLAPLRWRLEKPGYRTREFIGPAMLRLSRRGRALTRGDSHACSTSRVLILS